MAPETEPVSFKLIKILLKKAERLVFNQYVYAHEQETHVYLAFKILKMVQCPGHDL